MSGTQTGYIVQAAGAVAFLLGAALILDQTFPLLLLGGGAAAFYAGNLIRKRSIV